MDRYDNNNKVVRYLYVETGLQVLILIFNIPVGVQIQRYVLARFNHSVTTNTSLFKTRKPATRFRLKGPPAGRRETTN